MASATDRRIRSMFTLAGALVILAAFLVGLDAAAIHLLPAGTVHLNATPKIAHGPLLFLVVPPLWLLAAPALPGKVLRVVLTLVCAGGSSNLVAVRLFGGAPDYLIFRHGVSFGNPSAWAAGLHFFNVGDASITLGVALIPLACWCSYRTIYRAEHAPAETVLSA